MKTEAPKLQGGIVVASDDPQVQSEALKIEGIEQVSFIERMDSYYCVANEVIAIIKEINHWLEGLGREDEIPKDLLYWVMHCEGGDTSQRVLDSLLLIRSYRDLIDRFNPNEIILIKDVNVTWENELLISFAKEIGIKIRIAGKINIYKLFYQRVWLKWKPFFGSIYWGAKFIQIKLADLFHNKLRFDSNKAVMVQLAGSEKKHLNHSLTLLKAINAVGLQGIALGWRLGSSAAILRQEGIDVVELETWVSLKDYVTGRINSLKSWSRANAQFHHFLPEGKGIKDAGLLRGILIESMRSFFLSELFDRYCLRKAAINLFQINKPRAIRPHSLVLPVSVIIYQAITKFDKNIVLFINGGWPYDMPEPITNAEQPIPRDNIIFCSCGYRHQELLIEKGFLKKNIEVTGLHWIEPITDFKNRYTKNQSRDILKLKKNADLYILLDANNTLRGYCTSREQHQVLQFFLEFASHNEQVHLIIKPHPSCKADELKGIVIAVKKYALENVIVIDNSTLPYHAINSADILVTKLSTLAVEAMFLDVPTLGIVLDGETNFMFYKKAVEYYTDLELLQNFLFKVLLDKQYRDRWYLEMAKRRNDYFLNEGLVSMGTPATKVAEILAARLKDNTEIEHH